MRRAWMLVALLGLAAASVSPGDSIVYYPSGSVHRALGTSEASIAFGKPTAAAADSTLLTGLVSYWNLDESSDGSVPVTREDSVGANDLTDNNTTASAAGQNGAAASFVSVNSEYLSLASPPALTSISISMWWDYVGDGGVQAAIFNDVGGGADREYAIYAVGNNIYFEAYPSGGQTFSTSSGLTNGWHHIYVEYDESVGKSVFYLDNVRGTDGVVSGGPINATAQPLTIGAKDGGGYAADGQIDEVAIWSRVLTEAERTCLYNAGTGNFYPYTGVCTP